MKAANDSIKRDDNQREREVLAYCCSMFIGDESSTKCALNRVIHPNTKFKETKGIKPSSFICRSDTQCQHRGAYGTNDATKLGV